MIWMHFWEAADGKDCKSKIMELRSKRNTLWKQTKAFLEKHRGENGLVEASAVEQYNKMTGEVQALGAAIQKGLIPLLFQFDVL